MDIHSGWVKWAVGLLVPVYFAALMASYQATSSRQDRTDARLDAFAAASLADRRDLATKQMEMTTRQMEQFGRIMAELAQLRADISAIRMER